jgi:hypothetical protein
MPYTAPHRLINIYGDSLCAGSVDAPVLTYTVPSAHTLRIYGVICWGDYDAEFLIWVDGVIRGGGRTSPSSRTLYLPYIHAPISATAGENVVVSANHGCPAERTFRCNLLFGFLNQ